MTNKRESIPSLVGQTIKRAEYVDGDPWFDIEIETANGTTLVVGGYKSDASALLDRPDGTEERWEW